MPLIVASLDDDEAPIALSDDEDVSTSQDTSTQSRAAQLRAAKQEADRTDTNDAEDDDDDEDDLELASANNSAPNRSKKRQRTGKQNQKGAGADAPAADFFQFDETIVENAWDLAKARKAAAANNANGGVVKMIAARREVMAQRKKAKEAAKGSDEKAAEAAEIEEDGLVSDHEEEETKDEDDEVEEEAEVEEEKAEDGDDAEDTFRASKPARGAGAGAAAAIDFSGLNLSRPLLKAVKDLGFQRPTPVQMQSIPIALQGKDLMVNAATGSGKTAAFMLPILERLLYRPRRVPVSRVLVITPTRELATQCHAMTEKLAKHTDVRSALIVGGLSVTAQEVALKNRPDIIICTPGRLIDHLRNTQSVHLEDVEVLVLDEADRLLEQGFADELREIVKQCPRGRQTLLFSATLNEQVTKLVDLAMNDPQRILIDPSSSVVDTLTQEFVRIKAGKENEIEAITLSLCQRSFKSQVIIFAKSKSEAHRLMIVFGLAGLNAAELHGNLTQLQRLEALEKFRDAEVDFLICTDLAARGLDIIGVKTVINMQMPTKLKQYIHRVGRTARAGREGRSVTLVTEDGRKVLRQVMKRAKLTVKSRVVPPAAIAQARAQIEAMNDDIRAIYDQEHVEKEARLAEMEANKVQNLMVHERDIKARPAKTWFQTEKEKQAAKLAGLKEYIGEAAAKSLEESKELTGRAAKRQEKKTKEKSEKDKLKGLTRREKRKKMARMELEKDKQERKKELAKGIPGAHLTQTDDYKQEKSARKAKAKTRVTREELDEKTLTRGAGAGDVDGGADGEAPKKSRKRYRSYADGGDADSFDRRYGHVDPVKRQKEAEAEAAKAKAAMNKRHSHHGFKSKAKHKRR